MKIEKMNKISKINKNNKLFKIIKKRQIIIIVITLMLITAGYFKYNESNNIEKGGMFKNILEAAKLIDTEKYAGLGDAVLVSSDAIENNIENNTINEVEEKNSTETISDSQNNKENKEKQNEKVEENYYDKSRLEREKMYSQILDTYQEILENQTISQEQKAIAQNELIKINKERNGIMITENLILSKGFNDVIVFYNDKKANVIVKAEELKQEEISQIQNIITRELDIEISNVNISIK